MSPPAHWRSWLAVVTPLILTAIPLVGDPAMSAAMWTLYTITLMAVFWILELLPLPVTSLLPLVLLPLAGVASTDQVATLYLKGTNMMFVCSLIMAIALEHSGFHHRLSHNMISALGTSQTLIFLSFMLVTMFLSMWISNAATMALMVPIVDSITGVMFSDEETEGRRSKHHERLRNLLLLACAWSANIGATGVIIGTPANLVVLNTLDADYGPGHPLSFASWMAFSAPLMLLNTLLAWGYFSIIIRFSSDSDERTNTDQIKKKLMTRKQDLGRITQHEVLVVVLFILLVLLLFFQSPKFIPGWADLEIFKGVGSATPSVLIVALAFLLPSKWDRAKSSPALLDWKTVEKQLPWGVIFLLGAGFALADITKSSGLSHFLVEQLEELKGLDPVLLSFLIAFVSTFVTEITSNTACANIMVPILSRMSVSLCLNPIYLTLTCAICVSYAFMLPVASGPNAICYGASSLGTWDLVRTGMMMNIICILTTWGAINSYGVAFFGLAEFPQWASHQGNCSLG